ncbi:hypothetical protein ACJX0J_024795, partial [Zea mays]
MLHIIVLFDTYLVSLGTTVRHMLQHMSPNKNLSKTLTYLAYRTLDITNEDQTGIIFSIWQIFKFLCALGELIDRANDFEDFLLKDTTEYYSDSCQDYMIK